MVYLKCIGCRKAKLLPMGISKLNGREQNSRLVGKVLSMAAFYGNYPCHRVVNHARRC